MRMGGTAKGCDTPLSIVCILLRIFGQVLMNKLGTHESVELREDDIRAVLVLVLFKVLAC